LRFDQESSQWIHIDARIGGPESLFFRLSDVPVGMLAVPHRTSIPSIQTQFCDWVATNILESIGNTDLPASLLDNILIGPLSLPNSVIGAYVDIAKAESSIHGNPNIYSRFELARFLLRSARQRLRSKIEGSNILEESVRLGASLRTIQRLCVGYVRSNFRHPRAHFVVSVDRFKDIGRFTFEHASTDEETLGWIYRIHSYKGFYSFVYHGDIDNVRLHVYRDGQYYKPQHISLLD
jgi:hypothetical protein